MQTITFYYFGLIALTLLAIAFVLLPWLKADRTKQSWLAAIVSSIFVILFSWLIYYHSASRPAYLHYVKLQQAVKQARASGDFDHPDQVIAQLKQTLANRPNDAKGWYLLARLYFDLGRYQQAYLAAEKAYQLAPEINAVRVLYAQSSYLNADNKLTEKARAALEAAIKTDPRQVQALNLLAIDAYQRKDYPAAIQNWESVLANLDANSKQYEQVMALIAEAQKKLKAEATAP